jgi:hypothetical protein
MMVRRTSVVVGWKELSRRVSAIVGWHVSPGQLRMRLSRAESTGGDVLPGRLWGCQRVWDVAEVKAWVARQWRNSLERH